VPVTASATGLKSATAFSYTLVAATASGSSTSAPAGFTTEGDAGSPPPPPPPPGASGLTLTSLTLSPSRFRVGRRGTTVAFALSQRARIAISFERKAHGRFVKVRGAVRITRAAGGGRFHFKGVVAGRKLKPGRYRVSLVATAAGKASAVRRAKATVLRPSRAR
jgi:hypothetical protein